MLQTAAYFNGVFVFSSLYIFYVILCYVCSLVFKLRHTFRQSCQWLYTFVRSHSNPHQDWASLQTLSTLEFSLRHIRPKVDFINIFTPCFCNRSSPKRKSSVKSSVSFYALGIYKRKSCTWNVDEIEPYSKMPFFLQVLVLTVNHKYFWLQSMIIVYYHRI